jgi:hypothetical protein
MYVFIYMYIYVYKDIGKFVPLHPYIPVSPTIASWGPWTQVRRVTSGAHHRSSCPHPSWGKGVMSPLPWTLSSPMPRVRDPETLKFFIMSQYPSLCLMGYACFGQASLRSLSKWSVGSHAYPLLLHLVVTICATLEPPTSSLSPPLPSATTMTPWRCCLHLFLPPLAPSSAF